MYYLILYEDNIATPIAASFGDFFTISILAEVSNFIFTHSVDIWLPFTILGAVLVFAPIMAYIARRSIFTHAVILTGWTPIIGAVIIEQPGGVVMDIAFSNYDVMSTFQPMVNGVKFF
jgi:solute carrier family 41